MIPNNQAAQNRPGQPSFIGFDYQILATVWLALEFIAVRGAAEVLVEPPSQEDVAAELRGEKPATNVSAKSFLIQIKFLSNDLWSPTSFSKLVQKKVKKGKSGPEPRVRALELLKADATKHYLLITTSDVDPKLRGFTVREVGETSKPGNLNALGLDPSVAQRIGILAGETERSVRNRIKLLLQEHCHVPGAEINECISNLESAVRERLAGRKPTIFPRDELLALLSTSRGNLLSPVRPIYPDNFENIREKLVKDNVVLLVGPPGTGKSTMARMLVDEFRLGDPPSKHYTIKEPETLNIVHETINDTHSHVYFVEDPWGQGKLNEKARFFTTELAPLLSRARGGKTFIVTSRLAPYREAVEDRTDYPKWEILLDAQSYSSAAYREIYESQLNSWDEEARSKAMGVIDIALKYLETPYAVVFFCGQLQQEIEGRWINEQKIKKLAKESNVQAFGKRLRERIIDAGRSEIIPAIAIWAQLSSNGDSISQRDARHLRKHLVDGNLSDVPDVELFFKHLTTSRWLQEREGGFVVTPSVKEALKSLSSHRANFEDTVSALFRSWSANGKFYSILLCLREAEWDEPLVPSDAGVSFDLYLVSLATTSGTRNFIYTFRELADYSTTSLPAAEFARALRVKREQSASKKAGGRFAGSNLPKWKRPSLTTESVKNISDDPDCMICAKMFVVDYLADGVSHNVFGDTYPREPLLAFLKQFDWPLIEWFDTALSDVLAHPRESASYLIKCMLDLAPSKIDQLIIDAAIALKECYPIRDLSAVEHWRQYSEGESHAWQDGPDMDDERSYYIGKALAAAVSQKSKIQGHTWIVGHPHEIELLDAWDTLIDTEPDLSARKTFVGLCEKHGREEAAARVILKTPDTSFHDWAARVLLSAKFKMDSIVKWALLSFANNSSFLQLLQFQSGHRFESTKSLLAFLVLKENTEPEGQEVALATGTYPFLGFENLAALLELSHMQSLIVCRKQRSPQSAMPAIDVDLDFLARLAENWPEIPAINALEGIAANGGSLDPLIERFLHSDDKEVRLRAWTLCECRSRHLHDALKDLHYGCRNAALDRLSDSPSEDEMTAIFGHANDPSAYVRERLAKKIGEKRIREGIPTLIRMLSDKRDYGDHSESGEERIFTVARTACESLRKLAPLEDQIIGQLRSFLKACESSSTDSVIHEQLFRVLQLHPSATNTEFCSRYIKSIWLGSKWTKLGGVDIVPCCLRAICSYFSYDPRLAAGFDFSMLLEIAVWKNEESELVACSLAALALGYDASSVDLSPVTTMESFSAQRCRLLSCFSKKFRSSIHPELKKQMSDEYSFLSFLKWADNNNAVTFSDFSVGHADFLFWLANLENGNDFDKLLHEGVTRLIYTADASATMSYPFQKTFAIPQPPHAT